MRSVKHCTVIVLLVLGGSYARAQDVFTLDKNPANRLPALWKACASTFISDKDSVFVRTYFNHVLLLADSAGDKQLSAYVEYFSRCWKILFSERYEDHFATGDYETVVNIFAATRAWALENGMVDIAAACQHYMGQVYYRANRYGLAFEHLLQADDAFKKIGYAKVPNAAEYLYNLGLRFYQFEEYDKALHILLEASRFDFYSHRLELNTLNAIGLIYARKNQSEQAVTFLKRTIQKAADYGDIAWIGIGTGNLGNVFLSAQKIDSALYYHRKNYLLNTSLPAGAPEDAAKSALSMAKVFLVQQHADSALYYMQAGTILAAKYITDSTDVLDFRSRLLKLKIIYSKEKGDFRTALLLTDTLALVEQALRSKLDSKILSRAVEKTEAQSYADRLHLLKTQQDLARLRLYFLIAGLILMLTLIAAMFRDKWLKRKRQIELAEKDKQILVMEKLRAEDGLKHAEGLLNAYVDTIKEKTTVINHLESELTILKKLPMDGPELNTITNNREKLVASTILTDNEWQQFRGLFEQVYPGFSYRLRETYPELSPAEARLLYLTKLNLSSREMAAMLGISVQTIHKLRYRLRKKLNLEEVSSFDELLRKIT